MGLLLYGWNDIVDYEADASIPEGTFRLRARTPEQLRGLPLRIALGSCRYDRLRVLAGTSPSVFAA